MQNTKAYAAIIDYLIQFGVSRIHEGEESDHPRTTGASVGFVPAGYFGRGDAKVGDLIRLESAPQSVWRLSWLREVRVEQGGDKGYLCESAKDGSLCWWSNVGVSYFHRPTLARFPDWRWSDEQYAFNEKWMKACKRHDMDGFRPTAVVPNWKKITQKALGEIYLSLVDQHKAKKETK